MRRDRYAAVGFGGAGGAGAVASLVTSHMKVASCLRVGRRGQARAAGRSRGRSAAPRSKTKTGVGYSSILVPSGGRLVVRGRHAGRQARDRHGGVSVAADRMSSIPAPRDSHGILRGNLGSRTPRNGVDQVHYRAVGTRICRCAPRSVTCGGRRDARVTRSRASVLVAERVGDRLVERCAKVSARSFLVPGEHRDAAQRGRERRLVVGSGRDRGGCRDSAP